MNACIDTAFHTLGAQRVGHDGNTDPFGFLHSRLQCLRRILRASGIRRRCEHASRGHHLDQIGTESHLRAHGSHHLVRRIRLGAEEPAVTGRDCDGLTKNKQPRARDGAGGDRLADGESDLIA